VPNGRMAGTALAKTPTGIQGLDEVTGGGLPKGRTTLVCGGAGCGKSLLAMEFLVHGAQQYGEPGVSMDFEETAEKLTANVASLGFDMRELTKRKMLSVDHVRIDRGIWFRSTSEMAMLRQQFLYEGFNLRAR
jgi:circadian clock protein KaiC